MLNTTTGGQAGLAGLEKRLTGNVPDDSMIPRSVLRGARFMLLGATLTAIVGIFLIVATIIDKSALTDSKGDRLSSGQFASGVAETIITYVLLLVVWVVMARTNRSGYQWARILASLFCLIASYDAYSLVSSLSGGETITVVGIVYIVFDLALWVVGVLSIAMIWRSDASVYYKSRSAARQ
jgi:hypothetical protein